MFKDLTKLQKAGLIIGTIECVAGLGMAVYGMVGYKKAMKELEELAKIEKAKNEIDSLILDSIVDEFNNKED